MRRWILPRFMDFRHMLACLVLWPGLAFAGPALPPAPYMPPVAGAVLDYGKWRCEIADITEFEHSCIQGDRRARFFARFFSLGAPDRDRYGMTLPIIWCPGNQRGDFRPTKPLVLRDKARRAARSIWPLKTGKKVRFTVHDDDGNERIDLSVRVDDTESIAWNGQTRNVFRITATAEYDCNNLTPEMSFDLEPSAEYTMTWWYDPALRLVLKKRRDWPTLSVAENQVLHRVQMPAAPQIARLRPPAPKAEPDSAAFDLAFWNSIRNSENHEDFKAYLRQFPRGRFRELARIRSRPPQISARTAAPAEPVKPAVRDLLDDIQFGDYYALVIGNNNYRHLPKLETAINDATEVADVLRRDYGFSVNLLIDATRAQILRALSKLRATLKPDDNLMIYYAGHGLLDELGQQGYWLPTDAEESIPTNWISTSDITVVLRAIRARHAMVVADSCYSGTLVRAGGKPPRTAREKRAWIKRALGKRARVALVSGGLEPVADGGGDGAHSVFASAFINALKRNTGIMEGSELFDRIKRPVVLNSDQTPQYSDIRRAGHDGGEFILVRRKKP